MRDKLIQILADYRDAEGTDDQGAFRDLLTELRHVADAQGLDFDFAVDGSLDVYEEEQLEDNEAVC